MDVYGLLRLSRRSGWALLLLFLQACQGYVYDSEPLNFDPNFLRPTRVTALSSSGTYTVGAVLQFRAEFNRTVTVSGSPTLELELGSVDRSAVYISGEGTSSLVFSYTIQSGDVTSDLNYTSTSALAGMIRDLSTGSAANLNLPEAGSGMAISDQSNIVVDAVGPTVTITPQVLSATSVRLPLKYLVEFDEPLSSGSIAINDFSGLTIAQNYSFNNPTVDYQHYEIQINEVSNPTLAQSVTLQLPASQVSDALGNFNTASTSATSVVYDPYVQVSTGEQHSCAITKSGKAWCWGENSSGQLGINSRVDTDQPALVTLPTGRTFTAITVGGAHTCALADNSAAYCWGAFGSGQLGDGGILTSEALTPALVTGGILFREISAGASFTCGLSTSYEAYCWGANESGQLGIGTYLATGTPTAVNLTPLVTAGADHFVQLSAGDSHTCGIDDDGNAYCWGWNYRGQLGNGNDEFASGSTTGSTKKNIPYPVSGSLTFSKISAGWGHTCAVDSSVSGKVYCWGRNDTGQLGIGDVTDRAIPQEILGLAGASFTSVSAGSYHSCALTTLGEVACWGTESNGQLGNGSNSGGNSGPTAIVTTAFAPSTISKLSVRGPSSCGLSSIGNIYCWGDNDYGQLGINSLNIASTPTILNETP